MENLYPKHGLISRTYSKNSLIMALIVGCKSKFSMIMSPFILSARLTAPPTAKICDKNTDKSWEIIENLALYDHKGWDETKEFVKPVKAISTPQGVSKTPDRRLLELKDQINFLLRGSKPSTRALDTTFEATSRELMGAHTDEGWKDSENSHLQATPRENQRGLTKINEDEENNKTDETSDNTKMPTEMEMPVRKAEAMNEAENGSGNEPVKTPENDEVVEAPGSQPVAYYLKHKINEKLIKGLVNNNRFNNSLSGKRVVKKKKKAYNVLPGGPFYEAILKKKITKKEEIGGNFKIPCSIGGLKHVHAFVDQGLILKWEERIRLHQEKEMEFNQWRSKNFKDERPALTEDEEEGVEDEGEVT
ncbi:hypothetical protein Tco_1540554 [Tanacetum coccineum]